LTPLDRVRSCIENCHPGNVFAHSSSISLPDYRALASIHRSLRAHRGRLAQNSCRSSLAETGSDTCVPDTTIIATLAAPNRHPLDIRSEDALDAEITYRSGQLFRLVCRTASYNQ
jgi:hypothetical protein